MNKAHLEIIRFLKIFELDNVKQIDLDILKNQYKKLYKKYHPDLTTYNEYKDGKKLKELVIAYKYLKENIDKVNSVISNNAYTEDNINKAQSLIAQKEKEEKERQRELKKQKQELENKKQEELKLKKIKEQEEFEAKKKELEQQNIKIEEYKRKLELDKRKEFITQKVNEKNSSIDPQSYSSKNYQTIINKISNFLNNVQNYNNINALNKDYANLIDSIDKVKTISVSTGNKKGFKKIALISLLTVVLIVAAIFIPSLINTEAIIQKSQALLKEGNYQKAEEQLSKINTDEAKTLLEQIDIYKALNEGNFDQALDMFENMGQATINYDTLGGILNEDKLIEDVYNTYFTSDKLGYDFKEWNVADYNMDLESLEVTLEAIYELTNYMINYDLDGGEFIFDYPDKYTIESETLTIPTPEKEGYDFLGWAVAGAGAALVSQYQIPENSTGDVSLEAKWSPKKTTYVYDTDGGNSINQQTFFVGEDITLPTPTKTGYRFMGWYMGKTIVPNELKCPYSETPIELKAKWEKEYTIKLYDDEVLVYSKKVINGETIEVPTLAKKGYSFNGWFDNATGYTNIKTGKWYGYRDVEASAAWEPITYTVYFDTKSIDCHIDSITALYGFPVALPTPTKAGYEFRGWTYKGQNVYSGNWKIANDCTLEAKWEKVEHIHNYVLNIVNPTCTEKGYDHHVCECGQYYDNNYQPALGHNYTEWQVVKQPTETEEGIKERVCTRCFASQQESINQLTHAHNYYEKIINATCEKQGYTEYTCSCGHKYYDNYTNPLGHRFSNWIVIKEATETEEGLREGQCKNCGVMTRKVIPVKTHNHVFTKTVIEPTCQYQGYTLYQCDCSYSYETDYTDVKEHKLQMVRAIKVATCTVSGVGKYQCEYCNTTTYKTIPPTGHLFKYDQKNNKSICLICNHEESGNKEEEVREYTSIQDIANEVVAIFNSANRPDMLTTEKERFQETSHPNIIYVFSDAENLAKFKWMFEFFLEDITAVQASGQPDIVNNTYKEMFILLPRLIAGDTSAIIEQYPLGRTCLRQFIHELINADTTTDTGHPSYCYYSSNYKTPQMISKILSKANESLHQ